MPLKNAPIPRIHIQRLGEFWATMVKTNATNANTLASPK